MFGMLFTDVTDLALSDPQAAVAIATGDLVSVTFALVIIGFLIGLGQISVVIYGIKKMSDGNKERAAQHKAAMDAETNRHKESMRALNALIRNTGRHNRPIPAR